jgi:hypothetical protein
MDRIPKQDLEALFAAHTPTEEHTPLVLTALPAWGAFMETARAALFAAATASAAASAKHANTYRFIAPPLRYESTLTSTGSTATAAGAGSSDAHDSSSGSSAAAAASGAAASGTAGHKQRDSSVSHCSTVEGEWGFPMLTAGAPPVRNTCDSGQWRYYRVQLTAAAAAARRSLTVKLRALSGDPDLYLRKSASPTLAAYDRVSSFMIDDIALTRKHGVSGVCD